jgi:hypothetical protein
MDDDSPTAIGTREPTHDANERLPSAVALALIKLRLDQLVGWLLIATPAGSSFATKSVAVAVLHALKMRRVVHEKQPLSLETPK